MKFIHDNFCLSETEISSVPFAVPFGHVGCLNWQSKFKSKRSTLYVIHHKL